MIPFFRKLRKRFADNNQFIKYSRYAVGEIVLVVIGILIALSINNWNEEKKNNIIVNSVLKQIHFELAENIKRADELALWYKEKDSLIRLIMNDKLDYRGSKGNINIAIDGYDVMTIKDNGFKNLMLMTNNVPSNLNPMLVDLKELFVTYKEEVDWSNDAIEKVAIDYSDWLNLNTTWFYKKYFGNSSKITDEEINFYVSGNSLFKNWVMQYYNYGFDNHYRYIMKFRYHAYEVYKEITKILKLNKEEIDSFSFNLTDQEKQQIVGTYQKEDSTLGIINRNNKFYYNLNDGEEKEIFIINKNFYTVNREFISGFRTFNLDENKNVIGITIRSGNYVSEYKKIIKTKG